MLTFTQMTTRAANFVGVNFNAASTTIHIRGAAYNVSTLVVEAI